VQRAREVGGDELEATMVFARDCARGALIADWRGRRLSAEERDDVEQETLARVLDGISRPGKAVENLQDWVKGTVDLVLRERWRRERRHAHDPTPTDVAGREDERPDRRLVSRELREAVRACLEGLPEHERRMLILRYRDRHPNRAIAELVHKTEKAVEQAIPRALKRVRSCLERKRVMP